MESLAAAGSHHAVLSNTAARHSADARRLLLRLGGLDLFDVVVATASELDLSRPGKPEPVVFHRLLREWGRPAADVVMVGNTWAQDVLGATRAGIAAIYLTNPAISVRHPEDPRVTCPRLLSSPAPELAGIGLAAVRGEGMARETSSGPTTCLASLCGIFLSLVPGSRGKRTARRPRFAPDSSWIVCLCGRLMAIDGPGPVQAQSSRIVSNP